MSLAVLNGYTVRKEVNLPLVRREGRNSGGLGDVGDTSASDTYGGAGGEPGRGETHN